MPETIERQLASARNSACEYIEKQQERAARLQKLCEAFVAGVERLGLIIEFVGLIQVVKEGLPDAFHCLRSWRTHDPCTQRRGPVTETLTVFAVAFFSSR